MQQMRLNMDSAFVMRERFRAGKRHDLERRMMISRPHGYANRAVSFVSAIRPVTVRPTAPS